MRRERDDLAEATAVLYARKSKTDLANPGKSTGDQIDVQRQRADRLDLRVVAEFTDDGIGASRHSHGKTRPGFVAAVEYMQAHPVEVFGMWELSRATRRLRVYSDLMELCEDRGTYLLVGDRIYDPLDSADAMVLGVNAVMDAAEAARIRDRTLRGTRSNAAQGRPHGKNLYGYERVYDPLTRSLLKVRPHPEQAAVIREMIDRTLAGDSANQIALDLARRGIRRPSGIAFRAGEVREMLERPAYRGLRDHKGVQVPAMWEPLIEPQEWLQLRRVFAGRTWGEHSSRARYLLTGVVMCARCNQPMYGTTITRSTRRAYRCQGCNRRRDVAHLDAWVRTEINKALINPKLRRALAQPDSSGRVQAEKTLARLRAELEEGYVEAHAGRLSPRGLAVFEQGLLPQIEDLEGRLASSSDGPDLSSVRALPTETPPARELLRSLVRVWVGPSRTGRGFDPSSVGLRDVASGPPPNRE